MGSDGEISRAGCALGLADELGMGGDTTFLESEAGVCCKHKDKYCI